jgi:hypothetical protein
LLLPGTSRPRLGLQEALNANYYRYISTTQKRQRKVDGFVDFGLEFKELLNFLPIFEDKF